MRTYFKDKQIHISAAIVYGLVKYLERTGDKELLYAGGAYMTAVFGFGGIRVENGQLTAHPRLPGAWNR